MKKLLIISIVLTGCSSHIVTYKKTGQWARCYSQRGKIIFEGDAADIVQIHRKWYYYKQNHLEPIFGECLIYNH